VLTGFLAATDGSQHSIESVTMPPVHDRAIAAAAALARSMHNRLR
jgi:hypothetical protein